MLFKSIVEAFFKLFGFRRVDNTETENLPIRLVKSVLEGAPHDPDAFWEVFNVVGSDQHIGMRMLHLGVGKWQYDFKSACLVTPEGQRLPGAQGKLPNKLRDSLKATLSKSKIRKEYPAPNCG
ncbi:MAG: hypothetical protein FJ006_11065 [Chloroflexi bacterium]|nr:hypothetical protein [Chloroflexota bacterium]